MLEHDAHIHDRSPQKEAEALQAVAMAMFRYTPEVAAAEESTLLLSVGPSLTLFSGIHALCRRIRGDLRALGFTGRVSCAPTARGAWLLARCGGGRQRRTRAMSHRSGRPRARRRRLRDFSQAKLASSARQVGAGSYHF